ncbi:MAG TPA: bifunctional DNA-formamidopyrimidine glycosylase/DNA-(apurinic or apyrimidinic site) lyase [Polyangia bacterium]|nr:bifunctional DNA-formamidopyrimidine glycosylase/DNA-(apurinic or apyrimidinic site) lyase [Polyangia bacterium]
MPELPEVETAARNLRRWAQGRTVRRIATRGAARLFRPRSARAAATLVGAQITDVRRAGKNLLLTLRRSGGARRDAATDLGVWSHLGMTGKWLCRPTAEPAPRFARVSLALDDDRSLHYVDMRLFGRFQVIAGGRFSDVPELAALGPDPLNDGIDAGALHQRLQSVKTPIKVALLDQTIVAGVGNIQASEALFRARLDPRRPARTLTLAEVRRLRQGILASIAFTLKRFTDDGADSDAADIRYVEEPGTPNPFLVYGRGGQRCPRRRPGTIVRFVQAGRSTFFCPACTLPPSAT